MQNTERDPYIVLGVDPSASEAEVKKAYRALMKKYHPDNFTQYDDPTVAEMAEERAKEITAAYERIMNGEAKGSTSQNGPKTSGSHTGTSNTRSSTNTSGQNGNTGSRSTGNTHQNTYGNANRQNTDSGTYSAANRQTNRNGGSGGSGYKASADDSFYRHRTDIFEDADVPEHKGKSIFSVICVAFAVASVIFWVVMLIVGFNIGELDYNEWDTIRGNAAIIIGVCFGFFFLLAGFPWGWTLVYKALIFISSGCFVMVVGFALMSAFCYAFGWINMLVHIPTIIRNLKGNKNT